MGRHTSRDEVWNQALRYAMKEKSFSSHHIQRLLSNDTKEKTIDSTLETMADHGWLSENNSSSMWLPGPRIEDGIELEKDEETLIESGFLSSGIEISSVTELRKGRVYIAEVDRFSSSNAIVAVEQDSISLNHINLGPIDRDAKNELVEFEYIGSHWGKCLNEDYTYDSYHPHDGISQSSSSPDKSLKNIAEGVEETTQTQDSTGTSSSSSEWGNRKQEHLSEVNKKYD